MCVTVCEELNDDDDDELDNKITWADSAINSQPSQALSGV